MARSRSRVWVMLGGSVTVAALIAIVIVAVLIRPSAPPAQELVAPTPPPPPPPPVLLSATGEAPAPTADGVRDAIDELVRASDLGEVSALVVDALTGEHLYTHQPGRTAVPASAIKLVTAASALATVGASHQLATVAVAGDQPGEVVLVGGGDPTLAVNGDGTYPGSARLDELAEQVRDALGDTEITRVTVDASLFSGPVHGPWESTIPGSGYVAPITALMTDGGRVDPEQVRTPAQRHTHPDLAAGEAFAELLGVDVPVERGQAPPAAADPAPASPGAPTTASPAPGTAPPPADPPADPPAAGTELGRVLSPPLVRLVEIMLADSDNVVAEALARHVALARAEPATFAGAAAAQADTLAELGVPLGDSVLADGSGLSRDNRLTAALITDLLVTALTDQALAGMFAGLPVAGWSGTLADRYRTPPPDADRGAAAGAGVGAGVVRAKTGTLTGISSLSGLVVTADGRLLVFALLANDAPFGAANGLDRVAATLASCGCR